MQKTLYTRQYQLLLELLKDFRKQAVVTQAQLAERLQVPQSEVSKCESGSRRLDLIELKLWVEAMGGSAGAFLQVFDERVQADVVTGGGDEARQLLRARPPRLVK
ncbi:MAG: helix-turn-helix transcriptional regulator [Arenimonas sp.]|nr:helix-turn-helix transcriptional regulator [Arenimonas sp.]